MTELVKQVIDIVRQASTLMLTDDFKIREKGDVANIVTSSDIAVQEYLVEHLAPLLPDSGFLCEENDIRNTQHRYTWVIDPIDGTCNYARGIDQCAICVGLRHENEDENPSQPPFPADLRRTEGLVLGVVYLPRTGELFHATRGGGAYRNGEPIHVSQRPFRDSLLCTAFSVYHKEYTQKCADIIADTFQHINDFRRFGAAAPELCYLAMGRCELYFEYLLSPWDYAAASVILTEAGGSISTLTGEPIDGISPSGILAGNTAENLQQFQHIVARHL